MVHFDRRSYHDPFMAQRASCTLGNIDTGTELDTGDRGRYAFTGREFDVETQLQYNRARYYDATTGRWISQDPMGFDAGDSNMYRYVTNAPTNQTDPSGLQSGGGSLDHLGRIQLP